MYDEPVKQVTTSLARQDSVVAGPGTVILYFPNGAKQEFTGCKDIQEITDSDGEKKIVFTQGDNRFVFKKSSLAGWSLPLLPR